MIFYVYVWSFGFMFLAILAILGWRTADDGDPGEFAEDVPQPISSQMFGWARTCQCTPLADPVPDCKGIGLEKATWKKNVANYNFNFYKTSIVNSAIDLDCLSISRSLVGSNFLDPALGSTCAGATSCRVLSPEDEVRNVNRSHIPRTLVTFLLPNLPFILSCWAFLEAWIQMLVSSVSRVSTQCWTSCRSVSPSKSESSRVFWAMTWPIVAYSFIRLAWPCLGNGKPLWPKWIRSGNCLLTWWLDSLAAYHHDGMYADANLSIRLIMNRINHNQ